MTLEFTGSAQQFDLELLLPQGRAIRRATLNGKEATSEERTIESSRYAVIPAESATAHKLVLEFA
jgi:hypothetical protein